MLNKPIEIRQRRSMFSTLCFVVGGALLVAAAVFQNMHFLLAAVLPIALSFAVRQKPHHDVLVLEERQLVFQNSNFKLPYEKIRWLGVGDHFVTNSSQDLSDGPLAIGFDQGQLVLPSETSVPIREIARYLIARLPPPAVEQPHVALMDYWTKEQAKFGDDKVVLIHARKVLPLKKRLDGLRKGFAISVAGMICLILAIAGFDNTDESVGGWLGFAMFLIISGFVVLVWSMTSQKRKKREISAARGACIVMSPTGLAMVQGPLKGILRWDEIVGLENGPSSSLTGRQAGLHLKIAGGAIVVTDVYETSLAHIASLVRKNLGIK